MLFALFNATTERDWAEPGRSLDAHR